jgi:hypothetical protein
MPAIRTFTNFNSLLLKNERPASRAAQPDCGGSPGH